MQKEHVRTDTSEHVALKPFHLEGVIDARSLLPLTIHELRERFDNVLTMNIRFDDGAVVKLNGRKTIVSSIYWDYHREFPELPLLEHHHLGNVVFGNRLHRTKLSAPLWECFEKGICKDMDRLNRIAMVIFNNVYDYTGIELEEYVTTISVLDYRELLDHPIIVEAKATAKPSTASLADTYSKITDVIMNCKSLRNNAIAMACRAQLISTGQVLQAIGPRGFITDYDSNIFRNPVMTGYAEGLKSLTDSAEDSRSGTKSLKATTEPLRKTEYFGRKTQLQNQYVRSLRAGDCGSTETVEFMVTKKALVNLAGKYHVLPSGELKEISEDNLDLVGKLVKLRSPLACKHRQSYDVCECCAGALSFSIPSKMYYRQETRLGHICAISLCSFVSQKVMSVKHEDSSSVAERLNIEARDVNFIRLSPTDPSKIQFHKSLSGEDVKLVIPEEYIKYLDDINNPEVTDVNILPTTTLAAMSEIILRRTVMRGNGDSETVEHIIPTSVGPRQASFTYDFLAYLKQYGWDVDSYGNYVIDLKHWKFSKPAFLMPQRHMNMLEYMFNISEFIEKKDRNGVVGCKSSAEALRKLYDIVNSRANVNILHLEVLLMATLVTSKQGHDSSCPPVGQNVNGEEFNIHRENMFNRSASAGMAFERHGDIIRRPSSYTNTNKPDHSFDAILRG